MALAALALALLAPMAAAAPAMAVDVNRQEAAKLQLELRKLRQDTGTEGRLRPWAPLVGVAATLLLAAVGFGRWLSDRKEDRRLRAEEQTSKHLDRLLESPRSPAGTVAGTIASLRALQTLTASPFTPKDAGAQVTATLAAFVRHDVGPIDTINKAAFPLNCLLHWPPYRAHLVAAPVDCRAIVAAYVEALRRVHLSAPEYVKSARRADDGSLSSRDGERMASEDLKLLALALEGHWRHALLLGPDESAALEQDLAATIHNAELAASIWA